jgi:hypothetical protein
MNNGTPVLNGSIGNIIGSNNIGSQSVNFANSANTVSGVQTTFGTSGSGLNTNSGGKAGPEVTGNGGGGAVWSMHRPGAFGLNIGLDSDNVFRIGGWSAAANRMQLDMSGNFTVPGAVTVGSGQFSSTINMTDIDEGTRQIHCNSNRVGFLSQSGFWGSYCLDDGSWASDQKILAPFGSAGAPTYTNINDTNTGMFFPTFDIIAWSTNGSERMRLDNVGELLIGKTVLNYRGNGVQTENTARTLGVTNNIINPCIYCSKEGATGDMMNFYYNGTSRGSITTNGSNIAYNTSSDYRLKENIAPMIGALDRVALLKPVTFRWKEDGSASEGFIAHELQEVVPDAVTGEKDALDEKGNPKYQGVDSSFLVATLTAAIQELSAKVDTLQAELNTLKGN